MGYGEEKTKVYLAILCIFKKIYNNYVLIDFRWKIFMNKNYYYILLNAFISIALYADVPSYKNTYYKDANLSGSHSSFLTPDEIFERAEAAREAERLQRERAERLRRERAERLQREHTQAFAAIMRSPNAADELAALFIRFYQLYQ